MKRLLSYTLFLVLFSSCNTFGPKLADKNSEKLLEIYRDAIAKGHGSVHADSDNEIGHRLKKLGIDRMTIQYKEIFYSDLADSLVIFEKESPNIFTPEKRILYDFSELDRKFGDEKIPNASYTRTKIKDRWYYETIGFD